MTYEITYFHIISLIYNDYFVKLSISLQDLGSMLYLMRSRLRIFQIAGMLGLKVFLLVP